MEESVATVRPFYLLQPPQDFEADTARRRTYATAAGRPRALQDGENVVTPRRLTDARPFGLPNEMVPDYASSAEVLNAALDGVPDELSLGRLGAASMRADPLALLTVAVFSDLGRGARELDAPWGRVVLAVSRLGVSRRRWGR